MKLSRKVIESAAVVVFALAIVVTAITAEDVATKEAQYTKEADTEELLSEVATKEKTNIGVVAATDIAEQLEAEEEKLNMHGFYKNMNYRQNEIFQGYYSEFQEKYSVE